MLWLRLRRSDFLRRLYAVSVFVGPQGGFPYVAVRGKDLVFDLSLGGENTPKGCDAQAAYEYSKSNLSLRRTL